MELRRIIFASSSSSQVLISLLLLLLLLSPAVLGAAALSPDFAVLLAFKQQQDADGRAKLSSWDEGSAGNPCGRWEGVTCADNSTDTVTVLRGLDLTWHSLRGGLPPSFGSLGGLQWLDLSDNYLSGPLPSEIGNATGLMKLYLARNLFTGVIPATIGQLRSLEELSLEGNLLSGVIPSELQGLTNLTHLHLSRNGLAGQIPDVGRLTKLQELDLDENGLSGPLPELQGLTNLTQLMLNDNHFTGDVPSLDGLTNLLQLHLQSNGLVGNTPPLAGLLRLQDLDMSNNQLQGRLPSGIAEMAQLGYLNLSANRLSGDIPGHVWSNCSNTLVTLDLSRNQLNGSVPVELLDPRMARLEYLNLSYNNLSDEIPMPPSLDSPVSETLQSIDFSSNRLNGSVPQMLLWASMLSLAYLNLSSNMLTGGILLSPGWPDGLETLDLSNNALEGSIPPDIGSSSWARSLQRLWLHNNGFTGDIDEIWSGGSSQVSSLRELRLHGNQFYGKVGRVTLESWKNLQVLDLSRNLLSLDISEEPRVLDGSSLPNLRELRLGSNNRTGTLPSAVGPMLQLEVLDLSSSNLQGELAAQVFTSNSLPSLHFLDLSDNLLSGAVPAGLPEIANLTYMDLSGNNLSGPLPPMPSVLSQASFFSPGNAHLCGSPMLACPVPPPTSPSSKSGIALWQLLATGGACVLLCLGSCSALVWRWRAYTRKSRQDADLIAALQGTINAEVMRLRDLRSATANFSRTFQIGAGGFGTVYRGKLVDGTTVAIKKSKREGTALDKQQFLNEVTILSQVNHRNLVRLLGCCLENKVALLVFEFVPNGTLREHLQGTQGRDALSWRQRLQIAAQTADALAYLHSAANPPIFHRDVKSANVLLDEHTNAKVADFGISKLAPTLEVTHVSTAIQGTIGYIDPEYYCSLQLNGKSDVYSFGVVLLELVSGQAPVDFRRGAEVASLVVWAIALIEAGDVASIVDAAISETFASSAGQQSIESVARLAAKCLRPASKERPCMKDVVRELQDLWAQTESEGLSRLHSPDMLGPQDLQDSEEQASSLSLSSIVTESSSSSMVDIY